MTSTENDNRSKTRKAKIITSSRAAKMSKKSESAVAEKSGHARAAFGLEKDPGICLVYHVKDGRNRYLQKEVASDLYGQATAGALVAARRSSIRICADGDSWINILWPLSGLAGYEPTFFDILEGLYTTHSVAYPGDTFEQMLAERDYRQLVKSASFDFFIFSGGGNDVLGGGALVELLRPRSAGTPGVPRSFLRNDILDRTVQRLENGYNTIAREVAILSNPKQTQMLVHGYDVPTPRKNGVWLGDPFERRGYDLVGDKAVIKSILTYLVDVLYDMLGRVERAQDNVTVVNLRNVVGTRWNDELHPKKPASQDLAKKFVLAMNELQRDDVRRQRELLLAAKYQTPES